MATLSITNVRVSDERTTEFRQQSISSLTQSSSPFIKDAVINLTGYYIAQTSFNGKIDNDSPFKLVFTTSVGDISFSMLLRNKIDVDGNDITPDGTFNDWVRQYIIDNPNETIENFAKTALEKATNGLRVTRKVYTANGRFGNYRTSIVGFNLI